MRDISKIYIKLLAPQLTPDQKNALNEALKTYEDKLEALKNEIRISSPAYANLQYPEIITVEEAQKKLIDAQTAFFAYSIGKESSYAFSLSKKDLKIFPLPSRKELQKQVTDYLKVITDKENHDFHLGYKLYQELILPGLEKDIKKIFIVPDDILYFLPFEALPTQKNYRSWLITNYKLAYVPSLSSFRELVRRNKMNGEKLHKDILAFGDPYFGPYETEEKGNNGGDIFQNFYSTSAFKFFRLKYSGLEISRIASLFKPSKCTIFLRKKASEEELKAQNLADYKIIHFATHGLIDDKKPARSSIILCLDQNPTEDGFLQMREIFNLKLHADLVTLSACQTGLGQFIRGEGIEGLSRAFFYAGASSVLMSLWAINDQASYQLMERFYYHLRKSESIMNALRLAKLEMIESGTLSHPYYWAGFIITGKADKVIFPRSQINWILLATSLCVGGIILIAVKNLKRKKS
jgi:CHAT domain-containing protein